MGKKRRKHQGNKAKTPPRIRRINLGRVCRCCLKETGNLRDVMKTRLPPMLKYCTTVELIENDELPKQVCVDCLRLITKFYIFKKKVLRCNTLLQNLMKKRKNGRKSNNFSDILDRAVSNAEIPKKTPNLENENQADEGSVIKVQFEEIKQSNLTKKDLDEIITHISLVEPPPLVPLESPASATSPKPLSRAQQTYYLKEGEDKEEDFDVLSPPPLIPLKNPPNPLRLLLPPPVKEKKEIEGHLEIICLKCKESFDSIANLSEHERNCGKKKLECNVCKKKFDEPKKLIVHLRSHVTVKVYRCSICPKRYPSNSSLEIHMRTHTGERPFKCETCSKGFIRYAGLKAHMNTHSKDQPYVCDVCNRAFSVKSNLTRHKILHTGTLPFACNHCDKKFGQSDNLQLHIRTKHTMERPFLCNECGSGFVSVNRLRRHMWVHTGYKKYHCKQCTKSYTNAVDLRVHERVHKPEGKDTVKPYVCYKCEKGFYQKCRLAKHLKRHERLHKCDECSRVFRKLETLEKHKNTKHVITPSSINMVCEVNLVEET